MNSIQMGQTLKIVSVVILGLLLAVWLGFGLGQSNYQPAMLASLFILLLLLWFGLGEMFWPVTVASSFLGGTFPILRGSFTPFQILMVIGVAKFFVEEVIFRRRTLARMKRFDLVLLTGFMAVLTFHALKDRFGMRFLGSSVWGGRNYINVYVGLAAFFIIQSITVKSKVWAKLPYLVLTVTSFDLLIAIITTLFPASIYKIYPFYSAVSVSGITELLTGQETEAARVGAFGNFGFVLVILALASAPLHKIFTPSKLTWMILFCVGWVAVLFSSFRSSVFNTMIANVLAGIRDLRWAVLAFLPILAAFLFSLSVLNTEVIHLPKQIQRSLAFLPGKWDTQMELDAASSNDFRKKVWTVFTYEYFPVRPWFGRGFGFRSQAAQPSLYQYNPNWDRDAVEVGNVHNGFLAALDAFGVIGTIFFVAWNLRLLARTLFMDFRIKDPSATTLRFVALSLGVSILSYWIGALNVGSFLPQEFAVAGVFLRLQHTIRAQNPDQLIPAAQRTVGTKLAPI
jgi:O-Antigen ligase